MRKKEEETKYYSVDIGYQYRNKLNEDLFDVEPAYDDFRKFYLYLDMKNKNDSKVIVLVDSNDCDLITGEQYHKDYRIEHVDKEIFWKHTIISTPYNYDEWNNSNIKFVNSLFTSKHYYNYKEYNLLFYNSSSVVQLDDVIHSLKVVQKYGKNAYINAINHYRELIMFEAFGKADAFRKNEEMKRQNEVKEILRKIK